MLRITQFSTEQPCQIQYRMLVKAHIRNFSWGALVACSLAQKPISSPPSANATYDYVGTYKIKFLFKCGVILREQDRSRN